MCSGHSCLAPLTRTVGLHEGSAESVVPVRIPNADSALIEDSKLREYLLATEHPVGRYKARFFRALGYTRDNAERLEADLRQVLKNEVEDIVEIEFGTKYVIRGHLVAPAGTTTAIVTVWIILTGEDAPKLVTAYPGDGDED